MSDMLSFPLSKYTLNYLATYFNQTELNTIELWFLSNVIKG